jgi:enterochelin esterase-like enzyme
VQNRLARAALSLAVLATACTTTLVNTDTESFSSNAAAALQECGRNAKPGAVPCRLTTTPDAAELARIAETSLVQAAGDTLTFAVEAPGARFLNIVGGVRTAAQRVNGTDVWAASIYVPQLDKARIGFQFVTDTTGTYAKPREFRGARSAAGPLQSVVLHGSISIDTVFSYALTQKRVLISYMPPVSARGKPLKVIYAADGDMIRSLAPALDTLIVSGQLEPTAIVGVRAAEGNERPREYNYGYAADSTAFLQHEKFFVDEVAAWSEANLHVDSTREGKTVWGASNGGAFAIAMGLSHPDRFARVVAMSPVYAEVPAAAPGASLPQFFIAAGTFEKTTDLRAGLLVNTLRGMHAPTKFEQFVGGHDALVWVDTSVKELISLQ